LAQLEAEASVLQGEADEAYARQLAAEDTGSRSDRMLLRKRAEEASKMAECAYKMMDDARKQALEKEIQDLATSSEDAQNKHAADSAPQSPARNEQTDPVQTNEQISNTREFRCRERSLLQTDATRTGSDDCVSTITTEDQRNVRPSDEIAVSMCSTLAAMRLREQEARKRSEELGPAQVSEHAVLGQVGESCPQRTKDTSSKTKENTAITIESELATGSSTGIHGQVGPSSFEKQGRRRAASLGVGRDGKDRPSSSTSKTFPRSLGVFSSAGHGSSPSHGDHDATGDAPPPQGAHPTIRVSDVVSLTLPTKAKPYSMLDYFLPDGTKINFLVPYGFYGGETMRLKINFDVRERMVEQFREVTRTSRADALKFLAQSHGDLENALAEFWR